MATGETVEAIEVTAGLPILRAAEATLVGAIALAESCIASPG
jgi:hypothetical protein